MTVNVAIANTDAHARNHSLLLQDGVAELAPLYDVAPTKLFVSGRTLALRVAGQELLPFVTRGHLVAEMRSWGMSAVAARGRR